MISKIVTREDLKTRLAVHRANGEQIVFTNGCFDLLHMGHVSYLQAASRHGDLLVVGLNSDTSVRAIKGPQRPIVPQNQRAGVLAHLACIDYVVIFTEPDPGNLILELQPDILAKGADWAEKDIIGAKRVKQCGGRVVRIPLTKGISTSDIIETIVERFR